MQVRFSLRCRRSDQSALLTFVDADGSLGSAALLRPRALPPGAQAAASGASYPILVTLSGVGVEPQEVPRKYLRKCLSA